MKIKFAYYLPVIGLAVITGCKKEDDDFSDPVPQLTFVSVTPAIATEFSDSLVFTFRYRDNDGDLGENNPDVKNLFLKDNRIGIEYSYRVQQLAPSGSQVAIEGNLQVVLNTISRTDTALAQESATFSIYMVDRAGHKSNSITSSPVIIQP
jgi:hypothetical protein